MAEKLRFFRFMESWLDDMADWSMEDKNFAIWKLINYGIYGEDDLSDVPQKERAWYKNAFRVIDKGAEISVENAEKGSHGGKKNKTHDHEKVKEALLLGYTDAGDIAEYEGGSRQDKGWVYKVSYWKDRESLWKSNGIPVDSNGKPDFSKRIPMESNGKLLETVGIPMENDQNSNGKYWKSKGFQWKSVEFLIDSIGIPMDSIGLELDKAKEKREIPIPLEF